VEGGGSVQLSAVCSVMWCVVVCVGVVSMNSSDIPSSEELTSIYNGSVQIAQYSYRVSSDERTRCKSSFASITKGSIS